jgi:hypothetical protein
LGLVSLRGLAAFVGAAIRCTACCALLTGAAGEPGATRVESRSENLLAVGIVHADRMSIHVTRVVDNAPVRDAVLTVLLRGISHPTVAEADGSYTLQTDDLALPGPASLEFQVTQGAVRQDLKGTLLVAAGAKPEDRNSARQLWWWVLNFAVCIGFLMLISRRRGSSRPGRNSD